ncbi:protealysin inhibitor emfourin [Microbacterium sp. ZW T5_56]|uniref:protealysin inhibitor emfourin n=1 Tax=Microbacterium sp. ZW T5_56 TaxID=3378081 RepID=UPI003851A0F8
MSRSQGDDETADGGEGHNADIVITVVRSGGITGVPRTWTVVPPAEDESQWVVLIQRCPWDGDTSTQPGADRFLWRIRVQLPHDQHEQVIADAHLSGPWRELVEAVRAADSPPRSTT